MLVAAHQINTIRILDFLRHIHNIVEALVVPIVSFSLGLLIFSRFRLSTILYAILFVQVAFLFAISINSYWLTISLFSVFFLLSGQAVGKYSARMSSIEFYSKELLGWLIGSTAAYVLLPNLGAEKIYVITFLGFALFAFWVTGQKRLLVFGLFPLGLLLTLTSEQLNLYRIVSEIPSKRSYLNKTRYNGAFSIHSLGARVLDTIWTPFDRIDILQFPNGERDVFFSNQSWSHMPPPDSEREITDSSMPDNGKALILGLGSGIEFHLLERAGFGGIVGIEIYGELIHLMRDKYSPKLFSRHYPVRADIRHFLNTSNQKFDFILHSSPDFATKIGFSGWPVINEVTTYEAFRAAFERLHPKGILSARVYYKNGSDFALGIYQSLRSLSPEGRVSAYFLEQENLDTPKSFYLLTIKRGNFEASDHELIKRIYPNAKRVKDASVGDPEFFARIQEVLSLDPKDLSKVDRDRFVKKLDFKPQLFFFSAVAIGLLFLVFGFWSRGSSEGRFYSFVFFSGIFFALLEFSLITFFSTTFSNSLLAFLIVFQGLMAASWISNLFLSIKTKVAKVIMAFSPFFALLLYSFSVLFFQNFTQAPGVGIVFAISFSIGMFASFNFNIVIRQSKQIPRMIAWNLFGFTVGGVASWFLINEGQPGQFITLLAAISFYGLLVPFLRMNQA